MIQSDEPAPDPAASARLSVELAAATGIDADVVILPLRRTDDGVGVYDTQTIPLVKELREAGYRTEYLDAPNTRLFLVQESALLEIAIDIATGLVGTAMWEAGAAVVRRTRQRATAARVDVLPISGATTESSDAEASSAEPSAVETEKLAWEEPDPDASGNMRVHSTRTVERLTTEGFALLGRASLDLRADREAAETTARQALRRLASALNWAEDTALEGEAHANLDGAGAWVRQAFGCRLTFDDDTYWIDCLVRLGHTRVGLSIGGRAHKTCSLCGEDLSECPHIPGRRYRVSGGHEALGWCRVCMAKEACEHLTDETYTAEVVSIIDRMDLDEVSLVGKPGFPDARIERESVSFADLRQALGPNFQPGVKVSCDFCLIPCPGLRRPFAGSDVQ